MIELGSTLLVALVLIAFLSGIGITAIGPGGIFLTVALFALTALSSATIVGSVSVAFLATGILGTAIYYRSGELSEGLNVRLAAILSGASVAGALAGVAINARVSEEVFAVALGTVLVFVGILIAGKARFGLENRFAIRLDTPTGTVVLTAIGFGIGVTGGMLGIGGPVLAVPALVILGVSILTAVAVAQIQSIFVAGFATVGYLFQESISYELALLVTVPLMCGAIVGWRIAHEVPAAHLELGLGNVLILFGLYTLA